MAAPPKTPDGRYIVVKGRLWRSTNPALTEEERTKHVKALMDARRLVKNSKDDEDQMKEARAGVQAAKEALGERGEVWWRDGAPDYNRFMAKNTPYAEWFSKIED